MSFLFVDEEIASVLPALFLRYEVLIQAMLFAVLFPRLTVLSRARSLSRSLHPKRSPDTRSLNLDIPGHVEIALQISGVRGFIQIATYLLRSPIRS